MTFTGSRQARSQALHQSSERSQQRCDRSQAAAPGPQYLVRCVSGVPVSGRPDTLEQQQIADTVGALLRQLRSDRRMGLRDLEARSGVSRPAISMVERGLRRPRRSLLGWLAWGMDAEDVVPLTARLAGAAGDSMVAENRWSQRGHDRHAIAALLAGALPCPFVLLAPYAPAAFGSMFPGDGDRLRQLQAQAHVLPWPPGLVGSTEALTIGNALMGLPRGRLAMIGRAAARANDYPALRQRRERERADRAAEREKFRRAGGYRGGKLPAGFGVI